MALQGTLETFALPDVLRLLASTKKTGCYRLDGDRGSGQLWVNDGQIVAGAYDSSPPVTDPAEVAFELLRFEDGEFIFDADAAPDSVGDPADVEAVLAAAEAMLGEWKDVAAAVPSLAHWVALNPELPTNEVTVRADTWISVVAVGGGRTVGQLGQLLGLGELPVSRAVKDLLDLGLVTVDEPSAAAESSALAPPIATPEPAPMPEPVFDEPTGAIDQPTSEPEYEIAFDGIAPVEDSPVIDFGASARAEETFEPFDPNALVIEEPTFTPIEPEPVPAASTTDSDPTDAAEIARQLANLSPKAAKAVAAAAKATTQEEREAALAEVDETEDPINRDLLLKFLGSVNS